ncbi:MAG: CooT family nickel-binding protein [Candidatus Euphemobacter frigidus]|nr:CooT family nickel-binding protein [Candidatus Euphemobacter frigidus]
MCLSKAYLNHREEGELLGEEVTKITRKGESLVIRDLLGESKEVKNCFIREIDFIDNYVILDHE